ncbi:MAG: F0F1 ATP synthase subunit delta [Nocardioidaceae bacterium]|nr:F0F1 ATP synthase subunit delta [Nocardioidaceae bacterium]MCL2613515.1 F0F1 ATP synthase subunit delta [Nocardioidaceae bacterium]
MDLRGASAGAVSELTDELTAAVGDDTAKAAGVAESLYAAASAMREEPGLRRFVTDQTASSEAKTGLVREVFAKLDGTAVDLLVSAVQRRWTQAGDLTKGLQRLGEIATVRSAGADQGKVTDELFSVRELVQGNSDLRDALGEPSRSLEDKSALVDSLLGDKAMPATITLVKQALTGVHGTVSASLAEYRTLAADVSDESVATVTVAKALDDAQLDRLVKALARQNGRPVHANVVVDPAVIGGIKVALGDHIIDGTIATRLDDARRRIAG